MREGERTVCERTGMGQASGYPHTLISHLSCFKLARFVGMIGMEGNDANGDDFYGKIE